MTNQTASRASDLFDRHIALLEKQDSISKLGRRHNLLTTQEIKALDELDIELTLIAIEIETFLADHKARKNPIRFINRFILKNS
jgi:hypothetical protein